MRTQYIAILLLMAATLSGCVTTSKSIKTEEPKGAVFFPPKPEEPRLQFLTSFSSSSDFEASPSAFRKFIADDEKDVKPIVKPYGITIHDEKIYVCDTVLNGIDILDFKTRKFEYFKPKTGSPLIDPISTCFGADGTLYVADSRRGQVVIFNSNNDAVGAIGDKSEMKPTGVLINGDKILICDLKTNSVRVYGLTDKQYLYSIPKEGAKEEGKLFSPTNIALDKEGNLYVSDMGAFRIQKYSPSGDYLLSIGSHGDSPGQFARPKGIAVDGEGRVFAVDAAFENIQIFDKEGKLLLFFAEPNSGPAAMVLPAGITIDYTLKDYFAGLVDPSFEVEYLVFVSSQYGDRKLSVFGYGHRKR